MDAGRLGVERTQWPIEDEVLEGVDHRSVLCSRMVLAEEWKRKIPRFTSCGTWNFALRLPLVTTPGKHLSPCCRSSVPHCSWERRGRRHKRLSDPLRWLVRLRGWSPESWFPH